MTPPRSIGARGPAGAKVRGAATFGLAVALLATATRAGAPERLSSSAEAKIVEATQEVAYVNLDKARVLFAQARAMSEPGSAQWDKAIFGEASSIWHLLPIDRANADEAQGLFLELAKRSPHGRFTPRALFNLGRILELPEDREDPVDLPGARAWYQKVVEQWPADPLAGEATLRIAGTYIQTYEPASVREGARILRAWLDAHPTEPLASIMWQYLAETYFFPLADYENMFFAYEKVDALGWTEKGLQWPHYWRIALVAERYLKNRDAAVKYYTKIIEETPSSGKAYESQLALRRLGAPVPETFLTKFLGASDPAPPPVPGTVTP